MLRFVLFCLFFLGASCAFATLVGNPAEPALLTRSIFTGKPSWWSFRLGYMDDWVYQQRFQDEFKLEGVTHTRTFTQFSTYAGLLTLNFIDRIDLYGLVGASRMQIDEEIFTKRALAWGVGTKIMFLKHKDFFLGLDLKYFQTNQKPKYFIVEHLPYNVISNFRLQYTEMQAALGVCMRAWIFAPYANATYIMTKIEPSPLKVLVRLPDMDEREDLTMKSVINKKRWGAALGLTLLDSAKASLAVEWRGFNQNGVNVNGEVRF